MGTEKAMFGAGCFWHVEAAFCRLKGVKNTTVGYAGGLTENPTYNDVSTGRTGHAEVVLVEYDPEEIDYRRLLEFFWEIHDPTTPNRQGPDHGSQYRSIIFYFNDLQEQEALRSRADLESSERYVGIPIVTEVAPAGTFHPAEEYHQKYFEKHGRMSCG